MKIQRYDVDIYNDNNLVEHDEGDYVKYEDHIKQIEKLQHAARNLLFDDDAAVNDYITHHIT
jgi:hypothetical protein|tara:strand:+ start:181 stop:366 length:186 start_codon:yes stop_codon:yes gene_type:complete